MSEKETKNNYIIEGTITELSSTKDKKRQLMSLEKLRILFGDCVHWYNNIRFHSANDNKPPVVYRLENTATPLKKIA